MDFPLQVLQPCPKLGVITPIDTWGDQTQVSNWQVKSQTKPNSEPEFEPKSVQLWIPCSSPLHCSTLNTFIRYYGNKQCCVGRQKVLGDCCPPLPSFSLIILQTAYGESAEEKCQLTRGIAKQQLIKRIQTMATKHCGPSNSLISFTRVRGGLCQQLMR